LSVGADPGNLPPPAARGIAGQVVANTSLLVAVLVYMGWAYDDAYYGYFHINPLDLDVGIVEYMLRSLNLFSPHLVMVAVVIAAVAAIRTWGLERSALARLVAGRLTAWAWGVPGLRRLVPARGARRPHPGRVPLIVTGAVVTAAALGLVWAAGHYFIDTYLILALLGAGPLLLTWPTRAEPRGRFPYALAIVVTAVCALWATSLYARETGTQAAQSLVNHLPSRTSVVVYSTQRLALSGPLVSLRKFPAQYHYRFEYQGLRLLLDRAGTYYLLPVGWNPGLDITYVLTGSDSLRVELVSSTLRSG
jgi:hypothetical protein